MKEQLDSDILQLIVNALQDPGSYLQHDNYVEILKGEISQISDKYLTDN